MNTRFFKFILICIFALTATGTLFSQTSYINYGKSSGKSTELLSKVEDSLKKQFEEKKLQWPPRELYVRSFKYDRQLEIWIKDDVKAVFKLFKTYKVCMQSGTMGPKRMEGDYQVPEGFYYINEFNPNSNYHLALGLNYPNASDKLLSDSLRPGNSIYIHGSCVSTGCIPITDFPIEELYVMATQVKELGQDFIPVHVFPVRYNVKKSSEYLAQATKENQPLQAFTTTLKGAFDYFEAKKQLPVILINKRGQYIIN
ncbi:MAG: L,D-transpeptidase family protein [Ferruginibacter sp.]